MRFKRACSLFAQNALLLAISLLELTGGSRCVFVPSGKVYLFRPAIAPTVAGRGPPTDVFRAAGGEDDPGGAVAADLVVAGVAARESLGGPPKSESDKAEGVDGVGNLRCCVAGRDRGGDVSAAGLCSLYSNKFRGAMCGCGEPEGLISVMLGLNILVFQRSSAAAGSSSVVAYI